MLDVRRVVTALACVGLLAFPAAAGAQQIEQQGGANDEPVTKAAGERGDKRLDEERAGKPDAEPAVKPEEMPARKTEERVVEAEPSPYEKPKGNWITLTGTVADSNADTFMLDYGEGLIEVELDGGEWFDRTERIMPGERVRVYGEINDDLFERRVVQADSVYVYDRQSFFFPEPEDAAVYFLTGDPGDLPEGTWVSVSGIVKEINGREFVLDTGLYDIEVDTDDLGYNPLDNVGLQRIKEGDRIYVSGPLDDQFFEDNEILAKTVITLGPGVITFEEK